MRLFFVPYRDTFAKLCGAAIFLVPEWHIIFLSTSYYRNGIRGLIQ